MFVFIHGTLATPSLWLPQIRTILSLGREYSDREILNTFTLQLPGHPDNDNHFDFKDFKILLEEFQQTRHEAQEQLAQKMLLKGDKRVVQLLKSKKLILIGHSIGGALSLEYSIKNPTNIDKIIITSTPARFNTTYIKAVSSLILTLYAINPWLLEFFSYCIPIKRWKVAAHLIATSSDCKGFKSCVNYLMSYDFKSLYEVSSLNQQLALSNIPILLTGGKTDILASSKSLQQLYTILTANTDIITTKKTVIRGKINSRDPVNIIVYPTGHNAMDSHLQQYCTDVKTFLFS